MKVINYAYFKLDEKATRSVKENKNNFINNVRDKFYAMKWVKLYF